MKVISLIRKSESEFYKLCLESQEKWCKRQGYEFKVYDNLFFQRWHETHQQLIVFSYECLARESEKILFLSPSVMIMDEWQKFPLEIEEPGFYISRSSTSPVFDMAFCVKPSECDLGVFGFLEKLGNTLNVDAEFCIELAEIVTDSFIHVHPVFSTWFHEKISSMVQVTASARKDEEVQIKYLRSSSDMEKYAINIYQPGDLGVYLGRDKYLAKQFSLDFDSLRNQYLKARNESETIIKEVTS